uniref:Uncharacterized protein n=1 Tax=Fagus sylvatica TaxID=28930 RepID=A0A2N9IR29_FAGSY
MAFLAMANSIRLSGLLGWDYGSKSSVVSELIAVDALVLF